MASDNRRQSIALILIVVFVAATIGLLWWSTRPIVVHDPAEGLSKKDRKISEDLLSDPRFQELRSRSGTIDIGQKGNANPFEPFTAQKQ